MTNATASLKSAIASLWQMENELRYSAWSALALDKQQAVDHIAKARLDLNQVLNEQEPVNFTTAQPPNTDKTSSA